jgi:hypothetical protein
METTDAKKRREENAIVEIGAYADIKRQLSEQAGLHAMHLQKAVAIIHQLRAQLVELNEAISWDTTCLNCSKLVSACYEETVAKEKAEATVERARTLSGALPSFFDEREPVVSIKTLREALSEFVPGEPILDEINEALEETGPEATLRRAKTLLSGWGLCVNCLDGSTMPCTECGAGM